MKHLNTVLKQKSRTIAVLWQASKVNNNKKKHVGKETRGLIFLKHCSFTLTLVTGLTFPQVKIFAPNTDQMHVVDHLKGSPTEEKRNVLVESARLARGDIQDLSQLNVKDLDAIIFPG